jgi:hypothetical protein
MGTYLEGVLPEPKSTEEVVVDQRRGVEKGPFLQV